MPTNGSMQKNNRRGLTSKYRAMTTQLIKASSSIITQTTFPDESVNVVSNFPPTKLIKFGIVIKSANTYIRTFRLILKKFRWFGINV